MIAFYLSFPHVGSWDGKWSGEGKLYARVYKNVEVPKERVGKVFTYRWDDGWEAWVEVVQVDSKEANRIRKKSVGFCGYDWMIESIIRFGEIKKKSDW